MWLNECERAPSSAYQGLWWLSCLSVDSRLRAQLTIRVASSAQPEKNVNIYGRCPFINISVIRCPVGTFTEEEVFVAPPPYKNAEQIPIFLQNI